MRKLSRPSARAPDRKHETHRQRPESPLPSLQYLPRHREFCLAVHPDASSKESVQAVRQSRCEILRAARQHLRLDHPPFYTMSILLSREIN
jgi:hypothetical protein